MFPFINTPPKPAFTAEEALKRELPLENEPRGRLSLLEARFVGASASKLHRLRTLYTKTDGGTLTIKDGTYGGVSEAVSKDDIQALICTLIERETAYLLGMGVELDEWNP
jgi:hypothetical protein